MSKPIIGFTWSSTPRCQRTLQNSLFREAYCMAIRQAGGIPVEVGSGTPQGDIHRPDGILFCGGGDINPHLYGETDVEYVLGIDNERDRLEMALVREVVDHDLPFLGICRGLQVINVALGGDLYRDLTRQRPSGLDHDWHPSRKYPAHSVTITSNSLLSRFGFSAGQMVNSLHHQGIRTLGKGLSPIAHAPDGLIEGIELTGHRFGLAVQWHPEWLAGQQSMRCLFESFIHACERTRH